MGAHEVEGVGIALSGSPGRNGDNRSQKFAAVILRFLCERVVDGVPIFWTFLLQQLKRVLPDLGASAAQTRNDLGRQRVLFETLMPLAQERIRTRARHRCETPQ